jgi:hypothetical protein
MLACFFSRASECRALIVCGDAGFAANAQARFENWTVRWKSLLVDVYHFKPENVRVLRTPGRGDSAEKKSAIPAAETATYENVVQALNALTAASTESDQVVLVLIGHGYDTQSLGKFCLGGKDISDVDAAKALDKLKARQFICINTTPSSAPWAQSLARKNRLIITATNAASMRATTYFSEFMLRALKPGNVSMLDAFNTASVNTIRWYQNQFVAKEVVTVHGTEFQEIFKALYPDKKMVPGSPEPQAANNNMEDLTGWMGRRLLGEIAGLEDNGDGQTSSIYEDAKAFSPLPSKSGVTGGDGEFAKTVFLGKP